MATDKEADDKRLAEIIRKAKMTQAQNGPSGTSAKSPGTDTGISNLIKDVEALKKGIEGAQEAIDTVNTTAKIAKEATRSTWAWLKPIAEGAKKIWDVVYGFGKKVWQKTDSDAYDGKLKKGLAKTCRGLLIALSAGVGIMMIPASLGGNIIRAVTVDPVFDGAVVVKDTFRMQASYHEKETLYLNREAQTSLDQNEGEYKVKGTDAKGDPVYFVIKPGFLHSQWNLKHNGSMFYNTKTVASAIPSGDVAKCEATSYGTRNPFFLYVFGSTPVLLEAKCEGMKTSFNTSADGLPTVQMSAAYHVAAPALRAPG